MLLAKILLRVLRLSVAAVALLARTACLTANSATELFPPLDQSALTGVREGIIADVRYNWLR